MLNQVDLKNLIGLARRANASQISMVMRAAHDYARLMDQAHQVLRHVALSSEPLTTFKIYNSDTLNPPIADARVVAACRWLEEQGYMSKKYEPGDARVYRWCVTPAGFAQLDNKEK